MTTPYDKSLSEERPRVERMLSLSPWALREAVRSDYEATLERLRGQRYTLGEAELAYRKADEEREAAISDCSEAGLGPRRSTP